MWWKLPEHAPPWRLPSLGYPCSSFVPRPQSFSCSLARKAAAVVSVPDGALGNMHGLRCPPRPSGAGGPTASGLSLLSHHVFISTEGIKIACLHRGEATIHHVPVGKGLNTAPDTGRAPHRCLQWVLPARATRGDTFTPRVKSSGKTPGPPQKTPPCRRCWAHPGPPRPPSRLPSGGAASSEKSRDARCSVSGLWQVTRPGQCKARGSFPHRR